MTKQQLKQQFGIDSPISLFQYIEKCNPDIHKTNHAIHNYHKWLSQPLTWELLKIFEEDRVIVQDTRNDPLLYVSFEVWSPYVRERALTLDDFIRACEKEGIKLRLKK